MSIINFIKGIFIGVALVIPGLSGSFFAVVMGLYEKILESFVYFKKNIEENILFLGPVLLGIVTGVALSAKLIMWIILKFPCQSYIFFLGLVVGSFVIVINKIRTKKFNPLYFIITSAAFIGVMLLNNSSGENVSFVSIDSVKNAKDALVMLYAGALACSLMVIPGMSGGAALLAINQYGSVYNAVDKATSLPSHIISKDMTGIFSSAQGLILLIPFVLGAVFGLSLVAKLVLRLIKEHETPVYYGISGLVLGMAAILIINGVIPNIPPMFTDNLAFISSAVTCFSIGMFCSVAVK